MTIVPQEWVSAGELSNRVGRLQTQYAGNPLVKRIAYHIGADWSGDPAVFIDVTVPRSNITTAQLQHLAETMRIDLLRLLRTDEIGLHSYLTLVN